MVVSFFRVVREGPLRENKMIEKGGVCKGPKKGMRLNV